MGSGDETLFSLRLLAAGYKLTGALDVTVEHHFDVSRLQIPQLLRAARTMGRTQAFMFHHWEHQRAKFPKFHLLLTGIKLHRARIFYPIHKDRDGINIFKALTLEYRYAFYQEYCRQAVRPVKYPEGTMARAGG